MASVRLSDALTGIYDALVAALEPTPTGQPGLTITLGLEPTAANDLQFIVVGHDGSLNPDGSLSDAAEAGTTNIKFTAMGDPPLTQEDGVAHVAVVSQTGDSSDLPGRIAEVQTLLAACADAVADLKVGSDLRLDTVLDGRLYTRQAGQGCVAEFVFSVGYSAPWD